MIETTYAYVAPKQPLFISKNQVKERDKIVHVKIALI